MHVLLVGCKAAWVLFAAEVNHTQDHHVRVIPTAGPRERGPTVTGQAFRFTLASGDIDVEGLGGHALPVVADIARGAPTVEQV